ATNVAGSLRVHACELTGGYGKDDDQKGTVGPEMNGLDGVVLTACADVAFSGCRILGGSGGELSTCTPTGTCCGCSSAAGVVAGDALVIEGSNVAIHDGHVEGGWGSNADLV